MNKKRFIIASIVIFVAILLLDMLEHGVVLMRAYEETTSLWRENMNTLMWIMWLGNIVFSFLFVFIFIKGYENKGISEGIRFGIIIGLLINVAGIFSQYVIYPLPFLMALQWFVYGMIRFVIYGVLTALIYKPTK